jgi:CHAD domain-containing protein
MTVIPALILGRKCKQKYGNVRELDGLSFAANMYVIEIPDWHPTPLNKLLGVHWATAAKRKKADRKMVWAYSAHIAKGRKVKRSVEVTITLAPKQRACDPDSYQKSLGDALVHCCALVNDSHVWVEWLPVKFERGERKATRIVLRDAT